MDSVLLLQLVWSPQWPLSRLFSCLPFSLSLSLFLNCYFDDSRDISPLLLCEILESLFPVETLEPITFQSFREANPEFRDDDSVRYWIAEILKLFHDLKGGLSACTKRLRQIPFIPLAEGTFSPMENCEIVSLREVAFHSGLQFMKYTRTLDIELDKWGFFVCCCPCSFCFKEKITAIW